MKIMDDKFLLDKIKEAHNIPNGWYGTSEVGSQGKDYSIKQVIVASKEEGVKQHLVKIYYSGGQLPVLMGDFTNLEFPIYYRLDNGEIVEK